MLPKVKKILKFMVINIKECTSLECECNERVTLAHILFQCKVVDRQRVAEWSNVNEVLPEQMIEEIIRMSSEQKAGFILSCFNAKPIREWQEIYENVITFCDNMINIWTNVMSVQ